MSKTVVITGAGAGLGRTLARLIADRGDRVILLGRTLAKVADTAAEIGGDARALSCDVSSMRSVEDAFAQIDRIDVLINNAAIYEPFMVAKARDDQLRSAIETNYLGPVLTCRAAIPLMAGGGHIINISSESVGVSFYPMLSLYQSSKAGMERFSEALGKELSEERIRVTVVRAGQMYDENSEEPAHWDPDAARQFHELCPKAGLDLRKRPMTHFTSAAKAIAQLLDLPKDMNIPVMQIEAFRG